MTSHVYNIKINSLCRAGSDIDNDEGVGISVADDLEQSRQNRYHTSVQSLYVMRSLQPGSTPRTRNRITNKTRLKIYVGNIEVDPFSFDEDEEKNRLAQRVAGVDQDDANVSTPLANRSCTQLA